MPYPYGMYNAPTVGNGLGGLPRRTTVVAAPVSTVEKEYSFSLYASNNLSQAITGIGCFFYFSDDYIFWIGNNSTDGIRATFNRSTGTFPVFTDSTGLATASIGSMTQQNFDTIISDTLICSSYGYKATRSGTQLTVSTIVPFSGTTTIGSVAYNIITPIVRKLTDGSGFVVIGKNTGNDSIVFILDNTLNIVRSFSVRLDGSNLTTTQLLVNAFVTYSGILMTFVSDSSQASIRYAVSAVNISTGALISSGVYTYGASPLVNTGVPTVYPDYATNTFYSLQWFQTNYNFTVPYSATFNSTTNQIVHYDGTTGSASRTVAQNQTYGSPTLYNSGTQNGLTGRSARQPAQTDKFNTLGFPYTIYAEQQDGQNPVKLAYAQNAISEPADYSFNKVRYDLSTGLQFPTPSMLCKGKYQITLTNNPLNGYANAASTALISIGNNLFMTMGQGNSSNGSVYCNVFRRTET